MMRTQHDAFMRHTYSYQKEIQALIIPFRFSTHDGHKDFGFSLPSRLFNNLVFTLCLILTLSDTSCLMLQKWDIISVETRKLLEPLFGLTVGCSVRKIMF